MRFRRPNSVSRAGLSFSTNGDNLVIAAVAGQSIKVFRLVVNHSAATTLVIRSGAAGTIHATLPNNTQINLGQLAPEDNPYFIGDVGAALNLNTGAVTSGGFVEYRQD